MKNCLNCSRQFRRPEDFLTGTQRWRLSQRGDLHFNCTCGNAMTLPPGKYDWYNPGLLMSPAAASVFNTFASPDSLPFVPDVALELMQALADETSSMSNISEICKHDPTLAAQILAAASSASRPGAMLVTRMEQAIGLLGRYRVATLAQIAALSTFRLHTKVYTKSVHFLEAFTTGAVAEHLAQRFAPEVSCDVAYTCGAFCNVGKLLLALVEPELTDRIYIRMSQVRDPIAWTAAEEELGSASHSVLGEIASVLWGLPDEVFGVVLDHHRPLIKTDQAGLQRSTSSTETLGALVTLANQLTHCVLLNSHRVDDAIMGSCLDWFRISESQFKEIMRSLHALSGHSRAFLEAM